MSGVDTYDLKSTNSASYNKNTTATITYETNKINWYGFVKDKAGNTNDLAVLDTDIYIDTAVPVITIESGRIVVKDNEGSLLGVTVNGKLVRKSEGDCGLAVKGDVIKAYDKAGNVATYIVE